MTGTPKPPKADAPLPYRVLVGMNYPNADASGELRAERGDVVTDLPGYAIKGLLDSGYIEKVEG